MPFLIPTPRLTYWLHILPKLITAHMHLRRFIYITLRLFRSWTFITQVSGLPPLPWDHSLKEFPLGISSHCKFTSLHQRFSVPQVLSFFKSPCWAHPNWDSCPTLEKAQNHRSPRLPTGMWRIIFKNHDFVFFYIYSKLTSLAFISFSNLEIQWSFSVDWATSTTSFANRNRFRHNSDLDQSS